MKNRASLTLIEQVIMLLVLTVAAAVCLQIFVSAGQMAKTGSLQDQALQQAQSCAEALKSTGGDLEKAALLLDGNVKEGVLYIQTDTFTVRAEKTAADHRLLGAAEISVSAGESRLCSLRICWQEVAP